MHNGRRLHPVARTTPAPSRQWRRQRQHRERASPLLGPYTAKPVRGSTPAHAPGQRRCVRSAEPSSRNRCAQDPGASSSASVRRTCHAGPGRLASAFAGQPSGMVTNCAAASSRAMVSASASDTRRAPAPAGRWVALSASQWPRSARAHPEHHHGSGVVAFQQAHACPMPSTADRRRQRSVGRPRWNTPTIGAPGRFSLLPAPGGGMNCNDAGSPPSSGSTARTSQPATDAPAMRSSHPQAPTRSPRPCLFGFDVGDDAAAGSQR